MKVSKTPQKKEDTTMKRKKFLALALAGVITAATLTACTPLEDLYDWFFGGGSVSASRGNGVNLVELNDNDYNGLKRQLMNYFELGDDDVTTPDRSRKALEEVVGKLNAATMMDANNNELNAKGQNELNNVAKSQLQWNNGMCIDVMKLSPTSTAAADVAPGISENRHLYWAQYTKGKGGTFGEGATETKPGEAPETGRETYESALQDYFNVKMKIRNRKEIGGVEGKSKVDFFVGTFTKDGETYLGVVAIWELSW